MFCLFSVFVSSPTQLFTFLWKQYYINTARRIINNEIVDYEDLTEMLSLRTYDWRECDIEMWNEPLDVLWSTSGPDYVPSNQVRFLFSVFDSGSIRLVLRFFTPDCLLPI